MIHSDVIRVICVIIFGIAVVCFVFGQWLYMIYALIAGKIMMSFDSEGNSGGK
jgi:hypothetical protein